MIYQNSLSIIALNSIFLGGLQLMACPMNKADNQTVHTHTPTKIKLQSNRYQQVRKMAVSDWLTKRTDQCDMMSQISKK